MKKPILENNPQTLQSGRPTPAQMGMQTPAQMSQQQQHARRNDVRSDPKVAKALSDADSELNNALSVLDHIRGQLAKATHQSMHDIFQRIPVLQQVFGNVVNNFIEIQKYMTTSQGNPFPSPGQGQYSESLYLEDHHIMAPHSAAGEAEKRILKSLKAVQIYARETENKINTGDYRAAFDYTSELVNKSREALMSLKQYLTSKQG